MILKPWNKEKIIECHEPLIPIPESIFRLTPHPYMSLGAPYLKGTDPWVLRLSVVNRLIKAQQYLSEKKPHLQLALFDAWRPLSVQNFMVNYCIQQTCKSRGIEINDSSSSNEIIQEVLDDVSRFWALPSSDPSTPPPHSTGGAVDLTLADKEGEPLDLGGEIDSLEDISRPDFYEKYSSSNIYTKYKVFHMRRSLLWSVMNQAGFIQHPNEWWHFSFGDQLWCWKNNRSEAIYGPAFNVSKESTVSLPSLVT